MKILVAEDHATLANSLAEGLREEGYAVDLANDGAEADYLLKSHQYDCVVLDLMLPQKDGWEVLQDMRNRGDKTATLCLTARDGVDDRVKGLNIGADDYLVKPFAWEELMARVRALIRRAHNKGSAVIRVGDLEIDTAARAVSRAGKEITLTAREYALLSYLAMREGQVVTRTEIWEHLYDQNDQTTSNVVDVYIGYLRAKVDAPFDKPMIHTKRGHGYMLAAPKESPKEEPV
jgi:DNA-binding response OmpR family regulator